MEHSVQNSLRKLVERRNLTRSESASAMDQIMSGAVPESLMAAFLVALRMKGETVEEITGCAETMRARAVRVHSRHAHLVDTCGTGGDHAGTFNISTAAAIVAAAAGAKVAKHGNRAVSSPSGSADVLRALGVNIDLTPDAAGKVLDEVGITFLFAPSLHLAMKHASGVRKELGLRSVFNVLGPLTNPAGATAQVMGVYSPDLTERLAAVLGALGLQRALVVHGAGGMDEFSLAGPTRVSEWHRGSVRTYDVQPSDVGLKAASLESLRGGDAETNAGIIHGLLTTDDGPCRDVVAFNAAAALVAASLSSGLREGVEQSLAAMRSGASASLLARWSEATRSIA